MATSSSGTNLKLFSPAVAMATGSTIALEIMLTRIFSVTMYYHFAFMLISLALLGLAISGVVVFLLPRVFTRERAGWQTGVAMMAYAITAIIAMVVALETPISLRHWSDNIGKLVTIYVATGLPFLCSGFAVTLSINAAGEHIGRIYAFDLIGAAIGCVLVVPALSLLGAPGAILFVAALGAGAGALFIVSQRTSRLALRKGWIVVGGVIAAALLVAAFTEPSASRFTVARNPEKFLGNREVLFERWNAFSHITVAPAGADDHRWIFIDADAATRMWSGSIKEKGYQAPRRIPEVRVASLAYSLRNKDTALIIGPGGGTDVISALYHGVPKVIGVEINPLIAETVMQQTFTEWSGDLYSDPRVEIVVDEGRSYIRRANQRFGVIQATLVDTWAASSSGAFTLSENNIYTVEAFEEFFDQLIDDGIVTVTRWYDASNPKEFLRLVVLARTALENRGVKPTEVARHIFLATDRQRRGTLLAKRSPYTDDELAALDAKAKEGQLDVIFSPLAVEGARHRPSKLVSDYLAAPDSMAFLDELPWDVSPSTDNRPFFFFTLRIGDLFGLLTDLKGVELNNLGVLIILLLLLLSTALTALFVVLPLLVFRRDVLATDRGRKVRVLLYFLSLGLGFILVEIGLMQHFILFLGHPIFSLAVVLASLLLASGIGSAVSGVAVDRWGLRGAVVRAVATLATLVLIYAFTLTPLFHLFLGLPLVFRIVIAVLLIVPLGVLMGGLLPAGVRTANDIDSDLVPWGWGLNGATSVVGSTLAIFVSITSGFTVALIVGVVIYIAGAAALPLSDRAR